MAILKRCLFWWNGQQFAADLLRENGDVALRVDQDENGDKLPHVVHVKLDPSLLEELSSAGPFHYHYRGQVAVPWSESQ